MKTKILLFISLLLFVNCKKTETKTAVADTKTSKAEMCSDPINLEIQAHSAEWCADTNLYKMHIITKVEFDQYRAANWDTTDIDNKKITWKELKDLIGTSNCYEKFIAFDFDASVHDNSTIEAKKVTCFTTQPTCFSIPLFKMIEHDNHLLDTDEFEFTRARVNDNEVVIFCVVDNTTKDKSKKYYDVSHFPQFVETEKGKAPQHE